MNRVKCVECKHARIGKACDGFMYNKDKERINNRHPAHYCGAGRKCYWFEEINNKSNFGFSKEYEPPSKENRCGKCEFKRGDDFCLQYGIYWFSERPVVCEEFFEYPTNVIKLDSYKLKYGR